MAKWEQRDRIGWGIMARLFYLLTLRYGQGDSNENATEDDWPKLKGASLAIPSFMD